MNFKEILKKIKPLKYYVFGRRFYNHPITNDVYNTIKKEDEKKPFRTDIINYLLSKKTGETTYLEIGVRNPEDNFNHIKSNNKYGVDPGREFKSNPVEFKMKSDDFFEKLESGEVLSKDTKFDVIFIDGLHLANQVDRDIENSLNYIKDDGFIVLHDCNPPSEWHAIETYGYNFTPAHSSWNGTTWKAFVKWRSNPNIYSCCIDCDWGVGIISKKYNIGKSIESSNQFYEFSDFNNNKKHYLNLIEFNNFKAILEKII